MIKAYNEKAHTKCDNLKLLKNALKRKILKNNNNNINNNHNAQIEEKANISNINKNNETQIKKPNILKIDALMEVVDEELERKCATKHLRKLISNDSKYNEKDDMNGFYFC